MCDRTPGAGPPQGVDLLVHGHLSKRPVRAYKRFGERLGIAVSVLDGGDDERFMADLKNTSPRHHLPEAPPLGSPCNQGGCL